MQKSLDLFMGGNRPDILAALSTLASEWKDSTVYVSAFGELPERRKKSGEKETTV